MNRCPLHLLDVLLVRPRSAGLLLAFCVVALTCAFVAQYVFELLPCYLCLLERVPFAVGGILALGTLLVKMEARSFAAIMVVIALGMGINTGISFYHSGVERHWWAGTDACVSEVEFPQASAERTLTSAEIREALLSKKEARCDEIPWSLFGLSLANYNVPFCFGLMAFAFLAAWAALTGRKIEGACSCSCCGSKSD